MRWTLFGISLATVLLAAWVVPMPLYVYAPSAPTPIADPAEDLPRGPAIEVTGATDEVHGAWLLTTVSVRQVALVPALQAATDPYRDVEYERAVLPPGIDEEEFFRAQRQVFDESVRVAAAVGLRAAGEDVQVGGDGARVVGVVPGSPAEGRLQAGDVIVGVDGERVELASRLAAVTGETDEGRTLRLTVQRGEREQVIEVQVGLVPGFDQIGVGVYVETVNQRISLPSGVEVRNISSIGGPSAGLMMALTIYDLFDPGDLAAGRRIAGTGTVSLSGEVGPIGGIEEKVRSAEVAGMDVFVAPASQVEAARGASSGELEVVEAATVQEAIAALSR